MGTWTLAADESGSFDSKEPHAFLVGGVLLPKAAEEVADLRAAMRAWCNKNGIHYPPHSTEARQKGKPRAAEELLTLSAQWLTKHQGWFVGVLCKRKATDADAALHARMLGAFIELSARIAAARGASSLDLRPASRTFDVPQRDRVELARQAGMVVHQGTFHGVLGTEARESLDALARAPKGRLPPWPVVQSITVETAKSGAVHPGVLASDCFCNRTYGGTRDKASVTRAELMAEASGAHECVLVVDYHLLHSIRDVDDALRQEPPRLHQLGVALARLDLAWRTFQADGSRLLLGSEGAVLVAELLRSEGEKRLVRACREDGNLAWAIAQRLAGDSQSELDLKHGNYDGTRRALDMGFSGPSELAQLLRAIPDRELVARLYRLSLECANHTGDGLGATWARAGFESTLAAGASLSLLAEALRVENLTSVALQNELPCASERTAPLLAGITASAHKLKELAEQMSQPVVAFAKATLRQEQPLSDDERALRELTGLSSTWARSDREYGRCLGTSARSLAFAGDLDAATRLALEARRHFQDSPFDLTFNAAVLARIELERARSSPQSANLPLLRLLLRLSGAELLREAAQLESALEQNPAHRFAFDILLRQLLWAPQASEPGRDRPIVDLLAFGQKSAVYLQLRRHHSHPTEMIARHVAELLRLHGRNAKAMQAWFQLSLELTSSSAMPTLARLAVFTARLQSSEGIDGPPGSLLNPTFEYR